MGTELVAFQHDGAQDFGYYDQNAGSLADGISSGFPIIGYKGKVWSIRYNGQTHIVTRKDDGTAAAALNCIIIEAASHKSKTFYEIYEEGSDAQPDCASFDGVTPDAGVKNPQASACALCKRNQMIINPTTGKKMTECKDHKRIAVFLLPADTSRLLGEPLETVAFLRVPAASLRALADMGMQTERMGLPFYTYVTQISFDPQESYPKMIFKAVQKLTAKEAPMIKRLREDPLTNRVITGGGMARAALAAPQQAPPVAFQKSEPVETGFVTGHDFGVKPAGPQTIELQASNPTTRQETVATPAKPVQAPLQQAPQQAVPIDLGGLGGDPPGTADSPNGKVVVSVNAPAANVVADTGPVTEADQAIEDQIAALMPK